MGRRDLLDREPRDIDVVGRGREFEAVLRENARLVRRVVPLSESKSAVFFHDGTVLEWEFAWPGTTAERLLTRDQTRRRGYAWLNDGDIMEGGPLDLPSLDELLSLKLSHRYLKDSPHFWKTMRDVRALRWAGATVHDPAWLKDRERETYARQKHPRLNVAKDDFFRGDGVTYVYDHDTIHLAVAHLERPAYTYFKRPGSDVMCDRGLFEAAPVETRLLSVLEEAQVLALERSQVPHGDRVAPEWSMRTALMKVCSSITSGWWREFAWEYHDDVWAMYLSEGKDAYVRRLREGVASGLVQPYRPPAAGT